MRARTMTALLRGALCAGVASFPLFAADLASPDPGGGGFWALVLGLMATIFGGMALCYGFVKLTEKVVHQFRARRLQPVAAPPLRRAA
jgi:hypothetical protein